MEGEDTAQSITCAPRETYYRKRPQQEVVINLVRAVIGFDALETQNIVRLVHVVDS